MNMVPETTVYEVPSSRSSGGFRHGQNVDIVGVTGSIPVTPTIRNNDLAENYEVPGRFNKPDGCYSGRLLKTEWEVRPCSIEAARPFIESEHYARGASNTATYLHGLFRAGEIFDNQCQGIAWWIPPTRTAAEASYPSDWRGVLTLSRMAIAPSVPKNACSFLLARSVKLIDRLAWPCLVTYADAWRGHEGTIYKAAGWEYLGLTKPERVYTVNGRMTARKAGGRTRTHSEMLNLGAVCVGAFPKHKFRNIAKPRNHQREAA